MDIDVVVPWVDGSDSKWIREKNKYSPDRIDDSNSANRFRDWGLMKYWFRGIEKYIPWFHKLYFVTWGHIPDFLNIDYPRLQIVRHEEYIPHEWLPTFSSHTIELNVHRISGLAEHFIYFNDDTYLTKELPPEYFFKNGLPCAQATEIPLGFIGKPVIWSYAAANDIGVINKHFKKGKQGRKVVEQFINVQYPVKDNLRTLLFKYLIPDYYSGFKNFHCPAAFMKETFRQVWENEPEILSNTSSHKFRNCEDVNQWLMQWWQIASGAFEPRRTNTRNFELSEQTVKAVCDAIKKREYDMICVNDPDSVSNSDELVEQLRNAFENSLLEKSLFER